MKKIIILAAAMLAAMPSLFAQKVVDQVIDYTGFKNLQVNKHIEVKFVSTDSYGVKLSVDERIAENVVAVVKNNTLILDIDEKGYSKELKKELKAKNAIQPIVIAEVYAPTINKIILNNDALFTAPENIKAEDITFEVNNNANVKNIAVDASAAKIKMNNKAIGRFDIYANEVEFYAGNSASATLVLNCTNLIMLTENSTITTADGEIRNIEIQAKNSSNIVLTGNATKTVVHGSNSSSVNLDSLNTKEAEIELSGSSVCRINAKDRLKVELLNNSHLIYNANPAIEVERIIGSTMTKSSDTKYNKKK